MEHSGKIRSFQSIYGHNNHIKLTAYVKDGKVCKINHHINHYLHGTYSSHDYTPDEVYFEDELKNFIKNIYKDDMKTYESFVDSLDNETLEKYFKKFYVPK